MNIKLDLYNLFSDLFIRIQIPVNPVSFAVVILLAYLPYLYFNNLK